MTASPALDQAIEWFARLQRAPNAPPPADFQAWLHSSQDNRSAFEQVRDKWLRMEAAGGDPRIRAMQAQAESRLRHRPHITAMQGLLAASLVALVAAGGLYAAGWRPHLLGGAERKQMMALQTAVGNVSVRALPDGSTVTLDTDSALTYYSTSDGRHVELTKGRARFQVAEDKAHPFTVMAGGRTVTAVGTEFDVYLQPGGVRVNLLEGRVRVSAAKTANTSKPAIEMSAGDQLNASDGVWKLEHSEAAVDATWTRRQLTFDNSPLGDIAHELNRYSTHRIVIEDPKVAQLKMSAVINTGNSSSFLSAVDELALARVERRGNDFEIVAR